MPFFLASLDLSAVDWFDAISRLHPMLLHMPIGMIVALAILEFPRLFRRSAPEHERSRTVLVLLLAITTPLTALTGWLLHEGAGYGHPINWHEWLGISLAALSIFIGVAYWKKSENYTLGVLAAFLLLLPTAHFGASLTHGSDFLTEPWEAAFQGGNMPLAKSDALTATSNEEKSLEALGAGAVVTTPAVDVVATTPVVEAPTTLQAADLGPISAGASYSDIAPILKEYCIKCHGSRKQKGELALHTREGILAGSEHGAILVPGDPASSKIIIALQAPEDADEHMPPKKKSQPSSIAIEQLEEWIRGLDQDALPESGGADQEQSKDQAGVTTPAPPVVNNTPFVYAAGTGLALQGSPGYTAFVLDPGRALDALASEYQRHVKALDQPLSGSASSYDFQLPATTDFHVSSASEVGVQALRDLRIHVKSLSLDSPLLLVDFTAAALGEKQIRELLAPLAGTIGELSLFGKQPTEADLLLIGMMPNLAKLDLRGLDLEDAPTFSIRPIQASPSIESLNLSSTKLPQGTSYNLSVLQNLKRVHVWNSGLDEQELDFLRKERPNLAVIAGSPPPNDATEVEPEVAFEKYVDEIAAPAPENTTCPVSGEPVEPEFTVSHEGRTIGFCCSNCPKSFVKDPVKYLAILDAK
jgi:uncharacterized membrane protein/YHS domain-containing protein